MPRATALSCAVIGGGIAGAAAAFHLADRGIRVTLFEQFDLFHARGSSHGATRLFRMGYFEHPDYVPLLKRAAERWRALEKSSGLTLLLQTGIFLAGPVDGVVTHGTLKAAAEHELPICKLTANEAQARFPWFKIPADFDVLIEPGAGVLRADRAHAAFVNGARANGAAIATGARVHGWTPMRDGVEVATENDRRMFDRLVVTPGAWASSLLGDAGAMVTPLRKFSFWAPTQDPALSIDAGFLPFAIEQGDRRMFYGFPAVDADGIKVGEHTGGAPLATPEEDAPSDEALANVRAFLSELAPGLPGRITKHQSCLYAMSPDGNFLIDAHPDDRRVVFAAGFSGHGFKFAPIIGEALADLTLHGETLREFNFLNLMRFDRAKAD